MDFFSIIIDRVNSTNVFNMVQGRLPSRDTHLQTRVDDDLIQEFLQETERLSRIANSFEATGAGSIPGESPASAARHASVDVSGELRRMGETFFLQFFPEQIQDRLRAARDSFLFLHVDHRLRDIPWEILHTGQCFLADKFFLGKNIAGYWREGSRSERDRLKMLIIADPTEDLEWARLEGEGLFESLNAEVSPDRLDVQFLSGRRITKLSLLNAIKDRDIIHYAGHMYYSKDQQESGWLLADGKVLRAREIEKAGVVPDLVFANSCLSFAAGQTADGGAAIGTDTAGEADSGSNRDSGSDAGRDGASALQAARLAAASGMSDSGNVFNDLAGAFLRAGIHNYVGTNWEISDNIRTYEFALQFYRSIFEERSVGEALYEARRQARRLYESSDLTWARYSLHGNPMSRIYRQGGRRSFDASRNVLHARTVLDSYPGPIATAYSRFLELTEGGGDSAESMATLWRVFENIVRVIGALIFGNAGYLNVKVDAPEAEAPVNLRGYVELLYGAMGRLRSLNMEVSPGRLLECMYLHRDTIDKFLDAREAWATGRLGADDFDSYIVTYHYFIDNLLFDLAPLGRYQIVHLEGDSGRARLLNGLEARTIQVLPAEFEDPQLRELLRENANRVCFYNSSRKVLFSLEDGMRFEAGSGETILATLADESPAGAAQAAESGSVTEAREPESSSDIRS